MAAVLIQENRSRTRKLSLQSGADLGRCPLLDGKWLKSAASRSPKVYVGPKIGDRPMVKTAEKNRSMPLAFCATHRHIVAAR